MAHAYDATLKVLLEESPADWPALVGHPVASAEVIDADISTVSGAADRVIRVRDDPPWIMHVEFQSSTDASLPRRINVYNSVLEHRHELPVRSAVVLLRPEAYRPAITGVYERLLPDESQPYRLLRYDVIRVWELPPERLLQGGPGLLPLAPIGAVTEAELPGVMHRMKERLMQVPDRAERDMLSSATYILMGLRFDEIIIDRLMAEEGMEDSVTYQALIRKGREIERRESARQYILELGEQQFGRVADERTRLQIASIDDPERLRTILHRLLQTHSWDELLNAPS